MEAAAYAEAAPLGDLTIIDPATMPAAGSEPTSVSDESRVVAAAHDVAPFTMIGVTFSAEPTDVVLVRVRDTASGWTDWNELEVDRAEGPDSVGRESAGTIGTEPLWVGSADGYEVSLNADDADIATVQVVREEMRRVVVEAESSAAIFPTEGLNLNTRAQWGARAPRQTPGIAPQLKMAVVHHSASTNAYSAAQVPSQLRSMQAYHMDGRGWDDIGYNFVVDRFGGLWEGRGGGATSNVQGAHAAGFNSGTVGVMILGTYTSTPPSSAAVETASRVIGWKAMIGGFDPGSSVSFTAGQGSTKYTPGTTHAFPRVVGHQDVGHTECPGSVENHLPAIRTRASQWKAWFDAKRVPIGTFDGATAGVGSISVYGWGFDPTTNVASTVRVTVDGRSTDLVANVSRPDVGAVHSGRTNSGFSGAITGVASGRRTVCVTVRGLVNDAALGCRDVYVAENLQPGATAKRPEGAVDRVTGGVGRVEVSGWAASPHTTNAVVVDLLVGGVVRATVRADRSLSGGVQSHGFSAGIVGVTGGSNTVCARVRDPFGGAAASVNCRTVAVQGANPEGTVDSITRNGSSVRVWGWTLDRETTAPISIVITSDGVRRTVVANRSRMDVAAARPGYGDRHGFDETITVRAGEQNVCVDVINVGAGSNVRLGCKVVK